MSLIYFFCNFSGVTDKSDEEYDIVPDADYDSWVDRLVEKEKENELKKIFDLQNATYRSLPKIIRDWSCSPETIGAPYRVFTDLLQRIHFHKPNFRYDKEKKNVPETGEGLCRLPKAEYANIKFRDLLLYSKEDNDFLEIEPSSTNNSERMPPRVNMGSRAGSETAANTAQSTTVAAADVDDGEEDIADSSSGSDDSSSSDDELAAEGDDSDPDYARNPGVPHRPEEVVHRGGGVEEQMTFEEESKKGYQQMAYFGIQNVLTGKNPGLRNDVLLVNTLKAIAVLNDKALSDEVVDFLFPDGTTNIEVSV